MLPSHLDDIEDETKKDMENILNEIVEEFLDDHSTPEVHALKLDILDLLKQCSNRTINVMMLNVIDYI